MKGTPEAPACGFSARTVGVLQALDAPFAAVDVLPDPRIRQELSAISQLADDPAAVRRRRAGRRLRHRHRDVRVRRAGRGVACSVSRRDGPVAIVTDTTHYLPRELADARRRPPGQPVRRLGGAPEREIEIDDFDEFYARLRTRPRPADDLPALDRRLPRRLGAAARGRPRHRLDPPRRRHLGHLSRPPARPRRCSTSAASASRVAVIDARDRLRRPGLRACWRRVRPPAPAADMDGRRRARARGARGAADLVLHRHARVPAPRRAHRPGAGLARQHAEDQADPLARARDHAGRARPHRRPRLRADGRLRARAAATTAPTAGSSSTSRPPSRPSGWSSAAARSSAPSRTSPRRWVR